MDHSSALFLAFSRKKLQELWPRVTGSLKELTEDQIWWRPNEASNSIGNLLLHLNGNVRQWIVAGLGGSEDTRDRDAEFGEREQVDRAVLTATLSETLDGADKILGRLTDEDLTRKYKIQGYEVSGLDAVYQVVQHFAMHYGQILYIVKMLQARDLGFYAHLTGKPRV